MTVSLMGSMVYMGSSQPRIGIDPCSVSSSNESPNGHKEGGKQMDKWIAIAAAIPTSGVFAWAVVRFIEWRRKLCIAMGSG